MTNGDRLTGTVESWDKKVFKFKTEYTGIIEVDWDKVLSLTTDKDVILLTSDDRQLSGKLVYDSSSGIKLKSSDQALMSIEQKDIAYINPEKWRLGTGTKHTGLVNFSLRYDRSEIERDEVDFDFIYSARRIHDRFSLYGELQYDRNLGVTIKDEWSLLVKNDHFFTKKRYYSFSGFLEQDKGKGLDQRYYLGPALGYQFWESDEKNLRAEWGVYWTSSDLIDQEKRSGLGTGWFIDYDQYFYNKKFQFYHRQSSILSNRENMNFKSKTGLRLPVFSGFLASAELEANWDAETAESRDDTEVITRIKLGYSW